MSQTVLLEIGVEEIPANVVLPALGQMRELAAAGLERQRLEFGEIRTYGTPRRLALIIADVAESQPDVTREVKGPPADKAYGEAGTLTRAGEGFARSRGLSADDLEIRETDKGRFVFAQVREAGRAAPEVLAELWPELIGQLAFPKTMRWADLSMRFARPIRWIAALCGSEVVRFEVAGISAGRASRGHRFLHPGPVELAQADGYLGALERARVIVDQERRQRMVAEQATQVAAEVGGRPRIDPGLLEEVGFLVEYPTCLCGAFPERHLPLPEPVLVTVMAKHQRYFPVEDAEGRLMPRFIAVRNGDDRALDVVRTGNETVIVARFDDAEFYYNEDRKRPLASRLEDLERVTFMERQGSLRHKTDRIVALVRSLAEEVPLSEADAQAAARAAELCKCDLVTLMVQDLTSLQGVMGAEYARLDGEPDGVWRAIGEHYRPRFAGDELPGTPAGAALSIADKLDNLAACFASGLNPRGTSDPYALRRQAAGVVGILLARRWRVDLPARLREAIDRLPGEPANTGALGDVWDFVTGRLDPALETAKVPYDIRLAVLATLPAGPVVVHDPPRAATMCRDLVDAYDRGLLLERARQADSAAFAKLTFAAARVSKIIASAEGQAAERVDPDVFQEGIEARLWDAVRAARAAIEQSLAPDGDRDYEAAWAALCTLERPIWDYFDVETGVLVMHNDEGIRKNRLATLRAASKLFLRFADFTAIVVE